MKETIEQLRDGWYGNENKKVEARKLRTITKAVNCERLVQKCRREANTRFIRLCPNLSGTIGNLTVGNREGSTADYPIDLVVASYANNIVEDGHGQEEEEQDDDGAVS